MVGKPEADYGPICHIEQGTQLAREVRRVPDSLCLQQMTAFVTYNDLQSSPDCEPKSWDERIPKANAVYVLASSADNDVAARLVARQEAIENRDFYMRCGSDLRRSANALAARGGLGKVADKPTRMVKKLIPVTALSNNSLLSARRS